jgi:hypothetical protein
VESAKRKTSGGQYEPGHYKIPMTFGIMFSIVFLVAVCSDIEINGERLGGDNPTHIYGDE